MEFNHAARLIENLLRVRRPQPREADHWATPAEALTVLRRVAGITRQEMAFKLGISNSMLEKCEAGAHGGNLQAPELEKARDIALYCHLPKLAHFLHLVSIHSRKHPKRGPKHRDQSKWYEDDPSPYAEEKYLTR